MDKNGSSGGSAHQVEKTASPGPEDDAAADLANAAETGLGVREALRLYWKAVAWSVCVSNATIMESYMIMLSNAFYAQPQFQRAFGEPLPGGGGGYSITAQWQVGVSMAGLVGLIAGTLSNGYFAERWGLRKVMVVSHLSLVAFVFILFFAHNIEMVTVGSLLLSVPCGFFAAATPTYAAEVTPLRLRGYLTVYVNLCWVIGKLLAFSVLAGTLSIPSEWAYRLPFALQWVWPLPLAVATWLAPESPWWLVRQGRHDEALRSLERLVVAGAGERADPRNTLAMIRRTVDAERATLLQGSGSGGSYLDCFRGTNLRRTEIAMVSWGCQILPGFVVQNYITYFFTLAGLPTASSFYLSIGNAGLAFVGTVSSWFVMTRWGWRTMYLGGLAAMIPVMGLVAFLDFAARPGPAGDAVRWAQCSLLLVWFFTYGISIGPIPYGIAANVGAASLRPKTIALGRNTYYIFSIVNTVVAPYMLNPAQLNLKGRAAFLPWALTLVMLAWAYFRLPELKGLTQETVNHLFETRVPARRFAEKGRECQ
ncbi:hypothetical protein GGTG_11976 [Gaeumannomyces tritici R3-111a-1]|uniref:Major facilitator superfamily (MFS) profile domain-containing protein n=1 Tax=Gaeumannomyces tritici (strain R3-111a-1) TaxID=644352 RepID=J3PEP5_GAET3|nr:hypothetical protein GGTG_11976 [Gaeumannomyces tritici R3-111a-1]EJT70953.1 hypothetical protein GGTG_11976 [Gaeumannomyces tritici R3-111a-1]